MLLPNIPEVVYQDAAVLLLSPSNKEQFCADQYEDIQLSAVLLGLRTDSPYCSMLGTVWLEPSCWQRLNLISGSLVLCFGRCLSSLL